MRAAPSGKEPTGWGKCARRIAEEGGVPQGPSHGIDLGVRGGAYPAVRGWDMLHLEELKTRAKKLKQVGGSRVHCQ